MRVCNGRSGVTKPKKTRLLVFRDLEPGDVFRFKDALCLGLRIRTMKDNWVSLESGFVYSIGVPQRETDTRPIVLYPDACLDPGQAKETVS